MNVLTSWRESLKIFKPRQGIAILRSACYSTINVPLSWAFMAFGMLSSHIVLATWSFLCGASMPGAVSKAMTTIAIQEQSVFIAWPLTNSLAPFFISMIFIAMQNTVCSFFKKQLHADQYRQLVDCDDRKHQKSIVLVIERYARTMILLFVWAGIVAAALCVVNFLHLPEQLVSYAAYMLLMPTILLTKIGTLISYKELYAAAGYQILYSQLLATIGACWPLCAMFFFFMQAGCRIGAALRNSIIIVARYYPAFFAIRVMVDFLFKAIAVGGHMVRISASAQVHQIYWYVAGWIMIYWVSQFFWQIMYVLYQMWAPQTEQFPQHRQDHHDGQIVGN